MQSIEIYVLLKGIQIKRRKQNSHRSRKSPNGPPAFCSAFNAAKNLSLILLWKQITIKTPKMYNKTHVYNFISSELLNNSA